MKLLCTLACFCWLSTGAWAQQEQMEAYRQELKKEKVDTSRIHIIGDLAILLIHNSDTTEALNWLKEGLALCEKHQYEYGFGHIYGAYGVHYLQTDRYEEAERYFQLSHDHFKKSKKDTAPLGVASQLGNLSLIAAAKRDIEKAIRLKLQALEVWKATHFPERFVAVGNLYVTIAGMYGKEGQYAKAIEYDKKGIESRLMVDLKDSDLATCYIFLTNDFIRNKQLDSARKYISVAEGLVNELKSPILYTRLYGAMGEIDYEAKNYEKALGNFQMKLSYAQQAKQQVAESSARLEIGRCFQKLNQPAQAVPYFRQALEGAVRLNRTEGQKGALQGLAEVYHQLNNDTEAFRYLTRYNALKDSLQAQETNIKLNDIDTKYQTAQKENQILVLEKETRRQNTLIYSLMGGLALLALFGFLVYRTLSNQRRLARQETLLKEKEIQQLQQERQLVATNSILKGQEEERTRVARDLHDGLGGLLTGIKLTLSKVKGNFILPEAGVGVFTRALEQLDVAISEMRRVAHSMMPEALVRYGLPDALRDFCDDLNETGNINIRLQLLGMDERLESSVEVVLYRIVQELLNNVLKHARATETYVQLIRRDNTLNLTVEDNGRGFDAKLPDKNKGAGMRNIENRVAYLGGTIDIQSIPDEGTSVLIEVKL